MKTSEQNARYKAEQRARRKAGLAASPGRPLKPIAHGTERGAAQHRRRGERPCESCLTEESAARKARR